MAYIDLTGSCLCGEVTYKVSGESDLFLHCHCLRCRKATGTGHASNLLFKYEEAEWLSGEGKLKTFKVPDAQYFSVTFCSDCGSYLPKFVSQASYAVVPAGTLDVEPGILPKARIFQNSKTEWSCQDDLPAFEEYPS